MWRRELLFVVLIVFVVFIVIEVVVIIVFFVKLVGNRIEGHGMSLRDFHLALALRAGEDFAFLDFVFVGVNFRGALWTAKHRPILRVNVRSTEPRAWRAATSSVLYTATRGRPLTGASRSSLTQQTGIKTRAGIRPRAGRKTRAGTRPRRGERPGSMAREYPERPLVGVGGVVIEDGRALLIRRGSEPLMGQWSIPGGMLELGESLQEGVA